MKNKRDSTDYGTTGQLQKRNKKKKKKMMMMKMAKMWADLGADEFLETGADVVAGLGPHEQVQVLDAGATPQQFLHQHFAHEARGARDEDGALAVEAHNVRRAHHFDSLGFVVSWCCNGNVSTPFVLRLFISSLSTARFLPFKNNR